MKRSFMIIAVVSMAGLFAACGDDSVSPTKQTLPSFQNLSQKGHVLNNFEMAHNKRDINHYDQLLDNNFTFHYAESDFGTPVTIDWGRSDEITATTGLFEEVDKLDLDLDNHDVKWTEVSTLGGETLYSTTVFYNFTIKLYESTYIPNAGAKMTFTVRNAGTSSAPVWKLVDLFDMGGPSRTSIAEASAATEPNSWGKMKAIFR